MSEEQIRALGGIGILNIRDIEDFNAAERRVYDLIADGEWHTAGEIRRAAGKDGVPASEGLRRLRALRPSLEKHGYDLERKRETGGRGFKYRVVLGEVSERLF